MAAAAYHPEALGPGQYDVYRRKRPIAGEGDGGHLGLAPREARGGAGLGHHNVGRGDGKFGRAGAPGLGDQPPEADEHDDSRHELAPYHGYEGAFQPTPLTHQDHADYQAYRHPGQEAGRKHGPAALAGQHSLGHHAKADGQGVGAQQEGARDRGKVQEALHQRR